MIAQLSIFLKVEDIALGKLPAQQLTAQLAALG